MKNPKSILSIAVMVSSMTLALQTGLAQPSGLLTNAVTGAANALWDFSQLTNELQNIYFSGKSVVISYADPYTQDGHGKFIASSSKTTATVITGISDDTPTTNELAEASYKVTGSVTSTKGVAKLVFTTSLSGAVESNGKNREFSSTTTFTIKVDAVAGQVSGRWAESGRLSGGGGPTRSSTSSGLYGPYALSDYQAEVGTGAWTLILDFSSASGKTLAGTATVTLDSGTVYPFTFTGAFSSHTGESKLNLKGVSGAVGSMLQVTLNSSNQAVFVSGRIAGQTVNLRQ